MDRLNRWLLLPLLLSACAAVSTQAADGLVPPAGYMAPVGHKAGKGFTCPTTPPPFTAVLDFPSKYEGSGKSRDMVNPEAEARYRELIGPISEMEKGVNKIVGVYMETGDPAALKCAIGWYMSWVDAGALENSAANHTGRSLRKWSLASLSAAYARLKFSSSQPLSAYPEQSKKIENWLGSIADRVVTEWPLNDPGDKINNHYYWAAWAVMATAVDLNRRDLFDWSVKMYRVFETQIDSEGYLPNEMKRETRALNYHNYALNPLVMIAAFAKANGLNLSTEGNSALVRLAQKSFDGVNAPGIFEAKAGKKQDLEVLDDESSKLAWLEPYCWTVGCSGPMAQKLASLRPLGTYRMGGNLTEVFAGH
jgi:poly(beta-D-mannuronate) lyase